MNTPASSSLLFVLVKIGVVSVAEVELDDEEVVRGGFIRSVIRGVVVIRGEVGAPAEFTRRRTDCCGLFDK